MGSDNFKVIIAGGGPGGLTAAHSLNRAGIDFLLLEGRDSPVVDAGSNLVLMPVGMRALSQLGLLDALYKVSWPLKTTPRLKHNGNSMGYFYAFPILVGLYGVAPRVLSRHSLTKVLYDSLPDDAKAKVLAGKRVSDVSSTDNGVTVTCADGSSYDGTFVIGADGAHSKVRSCLRNLALAAGNEEVNVEKPFVTTFRCLWVRFSTADLGHVEAGETCETHGRGLSTQLFAGGDSGVAGLYEKLEKPTRERMRYTQADQEALVERWGHLPIVPNNKITVRELYEKRLESGLVSLEEGLVERWSWNSRVVLIGDAAHKFTPHTGTGCNQSILDVVALSNEIHKAVDEARANSGGKTSRPTAAQLAAAFTAYQDLRFDKVAIHCKVSGRSAKTAACISPFYRFMDRVVMSSPTITKYILGKGLSKESAMPVFHYLPGDEPFSGSVEWKNPIPTNQLVEKVF